MNRFYLLLSFVLLSGTAVHAQCTLTADAGLDVYYCVNLSGEIDTLALGGSPTAGGGTEPYTYAWSLGGTGADPLLLLSDTAAANPDFFGITSDTILVYLLVTDAGGCEARDTLTIVGLAFGSLPTELNFTIVPGDSAQLLPLFDGGLPPYTYLWTPAAGLSDPTLPDPWASPDTTTLYTLLTTDSVGCTVTTINLVIVDTATSLADGGRRTFDLFPNPARTHFALSEATEGAVRLFDRPPGAHLPSWDDQLRRALPTRW